MPRRYEDLDVGEEYVSDARIVTEADVVQYGYISGDSSALLTRDWAGEGAGEGHAAPRVPEILALIVQAGLGSRAVWPKTESIALLGIDWEFLSPLRVGDVIRIRLRIAEKRISRRDRGLVVWEREVYRQGRELVQKGRVVTLVARRTAGDTNAR